MTCNETRCSLTCWLSVCAAACTEVRGLQQLLLRRPLCCRPANELRYVPNRQRERQCDCYDASDARQRMLVPAGVIGYVQ